MRKIVLLLALATFLFLHQHGIAQEKFIDVRQEMANNLTTTKNCIQKNDWIGAQDSYQKAFNIWQSEVKPMITEGVKINEQFREYFDRMNDIDEKLLHLSELLKNKKDTEISPVVNAIIWGISHHPRGFDVPKPRYSVWDWTFGLSIGIGFCLFALFFGLHLRRSYYLRYKRK